MRSGEEGRPTEEGIFLVAGRRRRGISIGVVVDLLGMV